MRLIGLDPGLRITGWGVIEAEGNRLRHVAHGIVCSDDTNALAQRLCQLFDGISAVIGEWQPAEAAIEETFVNKNPDSTLKLGQARGAVLMAPARLGLRVAEYATNQVKKSVVGVGHADKRQVADMVRRLLPGIDATADAADALAVAICHAHNCATLDRWQGRTEAADVTMARGGRLGASRRTTSAERAAAERALLQRALGVTDLPRGRR